jgi:MFS family permease
MMIAAALAAALCPALLALGGSTPVDVTLTIAFGALSSFQVLQYAHVRDTYPNELSGRALSTLNMAAFLGVAIAQGLAGLIADWASAHGHDPVVAVCAFLAAALAGGALAYSILPRSTARVS